VIDPYTDPRTGVRRNRLGIVDPNRLSEVEFAITRAAIAIHGKTVLPGCYDLPHLQDFHRRVFGRIYPWAGEIRTVAIAKTDLFCLPQHIEPYAAEVFGQLADEKQLRDLPRERFVSRLTHFYAEVNALHPFREGNGRTQRAFFSQLARAAGWPIDWTTLDAERNTETSIASLRGDNRPLLAMFDDLVAP
jgi:cell filamentation protein